MLSFRIAFPLSVAMLSLALLPIYTFATELRTVALRGQPVPGIAIGATYNFFNDPPVINNSGHTAFVAFLNDANQSFLGDGVLSEGSGTLDLIALMGTQAPDAPVGAEFVSLSLPILNDNGNLAFAGLAFANNPGPSFSGLFTHQSGNSRAVILDGTQAPGTSNGVVFDGLINGISRLNSAGDIASRFFIEGRGVDSSNDTGIWSTSSGVLTLVARDGNQAPGTPDGVLFDLSGAEPVLNDAGALAFRSVLSGPTVDSTNNIGLWAGAPGNLRLVAREGNRAPGTASDVKFRAFSRPTINVSGNTAFSASLIGNGVDFTNDGGVWSEASGALELLARSGSAAPDVNDAAVFRSFGSPILNDVGQVVFEASLEGINVNILNDNGIWLGEAGSLALVIRGGDQPPGTPTGAEFDDFGPIVLNSNNQLAFAADLFIPQQIVRNGPIVGNPAGGVDSTNDSGIWATDLQGALHLIAREGDLLEVNPGDFRTISSLDFAGGTGNGDGRASGFNDLGQIAFSASFTDGSSGVFVSNLVAIPEPSTLILVLISCVFGLRVRQLS